MLSRVLRACLVIASAVLAPPGAVALEDAPEPLAFVVRPSGTVGEETLDQKLARRERGFRFICIGCVRVPGAPEPNAPFYPHAVLRAQGMSQALVGPGGGELPLATPPEP